MSRILATTSVHSSRISNVKSLCKSFAEDGQLFSWGWNKYGQLGLGDSVDRTTPSQVSIKGVPKNVACGWWHTLLLVETPN